ncbi:MFS transporter [Solibacillus sp. MA9]|uniref:MFS transporter n=1 Tax=Solibacillus palustris TaxID=2908203 RepID=A0ABS9UI30_9BACL|nr:MFS transporter [Solibacillus sp. MA9]MCH7324001.1 MFS transporter [Solibacillus sp. MA9]
MWRNRNVWIVLIGEFVVGLGLWAGIIGNLAFMTEFVASDFHKSVILAIGMLAGVIVAPLAGKIIDASSKKKVLIGSSIARVITVFVMFAAIAFDSVLLMIVFLILLQIAATFFMPAIQSIIPKIVDKKDLLSLNGWHMNARTLSRIVGAASAGLFVAYVDLIWLYVVSLIMYAVVLVTLFFLHIDESIVESKTQKKESSSFKEVLPVLKQYPVVLVTLVLIVVPILFLGSFNLMIMKIAQMHDSTSISGLLYTVEGVGFMLGAIAVKYLGIRMKTGTMMFSLALLIGVLQSLLFFSTIEIMNVVIFAVFGFAVGCFFPTTMTIFQKQMPAEYHGRFFAFRNMIDQTLFQLVLLSTGALLDWFGLPITGLAFGLFSLMLTIFFMLYLKSKKYSLAFE